MSTSTLPPEARHGSVAFFAGADFGINAGGVKKYKKEAGGKTSLVLEGVPVFRSGTFRDSMGYQHTWEDIHMDQMVANFNYLLANKILESVPVRKGHGSFLGDPMDGLIGWHSQIVTEKRKNPVDGVEYTYLLADYEIMDPDAILKIDSGLWRNLSSEISPYFTNDEAEFFPCYMGVAYVDFSAVEGLREFSKSKPNFSFVMEDNKEAPDVAGETNNTGPTDQSGTGQAAGTPAPTTGPVGGAPEQGATTEGQQTAAPAADAAGTESTEGAATEQTDHSKGGTVFAFKLFGKPTLGLPIAGLTGPQLQAFQSAQAHIDYLEEYRTGQIEGSRKDFVKKLSDDKKIPATEVANLTKVALALDDENYNLWSASYGSAPALPLFDASHGQQPTDQGAPQSTPEAEKADRIEVLDAIVADFRRSGFTKERIESSKAWTELQQLKSTTNQS